MRIYNGRVWSMAGSDIENGYVAIENGKITELGICGNDFVPAPDDLNAEGGVIMPGIIDASTSIGLREAGGGNEGNDLDETSEPLVPEMRAIDAIYPKDESFALALRAGVTSAVSAPGNSNVIGGQASFIKFRGRTTAEMALKPSCAVKITLGEEPKIEWAHRAHGPQSRLAEVAMLREMFEQAREYNAACAAVARNRNARYEALLPLLRGEIPAFIHAHRADDIYAGVELAHTYGFRCVILGGAEAWMMSDYLRENNVPIVLGPILLVNSRFENRNATPRAAAKLYKAGVQFALSSDHLNTPIEYLPISAAICVRYGLDEREALHAITINAAKIAGVGDRVGSLEPGKEADIAVFTGNPFNYRVVTKAVFIDGERMI